MVLLDCFTIEDKGDNSFETSETPLLEPQILQTSQLTLRRLMFNRILFSIIRYKLR